jgi:catechol 2,3-dioxygenase-like lactoylglutathione lyase family enzyme
MITKLGTVNVFVEDQDEALTFWTEQVGFEMRDDVTLPELGGFRWLTVGPPMQPDVTLALMTIPGPPVFEPDTKAKLEELLPKGVLGGLFFQTDDCRGTYEELKARGVEFSEEPTERPYGIDCAFRDPSGNSARIVQAVPGLPAQG